MKYRLFLSITASGVLGSAAFAGTMGPVMPSKDCAWVGSITGGPVWARWWDADLFSYAGH